MDTYPEWTAETNRLSVRALYCDVLENKAKEDNQKSGWKTSGDFELWNMQFKDAITSCKDRHGDS